MLNSKETIHSCDKAFCLFETVFCEGLEPCSNASEMLYAAKILVAKERGDEDGMSQWAQARHIERRSFENPALVIQIEQKRFHVRYEADGYSRRIVKEMLCD